MLPVPVRGLADRLAKGATGELALWAARRVQRALGEETLSAAFSTALWARARLQGLTRAQKLVRTSVVFWRHPGRCWLLAYDLPRPGPREILIRTIASAVSPGTERALYMWLPNARASFPLLPGYSLAGEVVAVGQRVRGVRRGDLVAGSGPHAGAALLPAERAYPIPECVDPEEASFLWLGVIASQALDRGEVGADQSAVVLGRGLVGQLLAQMAAAAGARVASVARSDRRRNRALERVARLTSLSEARERAEADVVFETTGHPEGPSLALSMARKGGRVVLAGSSRGATPSMDFGAMADRGVEFVGAHVSGVADPRPHAERFLRLLAERRLDLAPLIQERVHPWEAGWFYRRLATSDDATVGAVFRWDRLPERDRLRRVSYLAPPDLSFVSRNYVPPLPGVARP